MVVLRSKQAEVLLVELLRYLVVSRRLEPEGQSTSRVDQVRVARVAQCSFHQHPDLLDRALLQSDLEEQVVRLVH